MLNCLQMNRGVEEKNRCRNCKKEEWHAGVACWRAGVLMTSWGEMWSVCLTLKCLAWCVLLCMTFSTVCWSGLWCSVEMADMTCFAEQYLLHYVLLCNTFCTICQTGLWCGVEMHCMCFPVQYLSYYLSDMLMMQGWNAWGDMFLPCSTFCTVLLCNTFCTICQTGLRCRVTWVFLRNTFCTIFCHAIPFALSVRLACCAALKCLACSSMQYLSHTVCWTLS